MFVTATAGIVGMWMLMVSRTQSKREKFLENRLHEASGLTSAQAAAAKVEGSVIVKEKTTGALTNLDRAAGQALKGSPLERWLEQTGNTSSIGTVIGVTVMLGITAATAALMFSRVWWAAVLAFVAGLSLKPLLLKRQRARRLYKFEEHFPEALDLLSRAVRAGHAFSAGMKMVADELGEPVGPEFRKAFDEQNYGLPLKESLNNLAARIPLLDVRFFATAVLIQRETGGNLAEILDNLSNVVRERFKIRRQVRVHTAHGRFTGYVLMALPAFLALALSFINPSHMELLFNERIGQMMIGGIIVMQAIGYVWIKQIIKIEV
jgi:tight adherence protein B